MSGEYTSGSRYQVVTSTGFPFRSYGKTVALFLLFFLPNLVWAFCSNPLGEMTSVATAASAAFIMAVPLFFISLLLTSLGRPCTVFVTAVSSVQSAVASIGLLHRLIYGHGLSPSTVYLVLNSNLSEAGNYLGLYGTPLVIIPWVAFLAAMTAVTIFFVRSSYRTPVVHRSWIDAGLLLLLAAGSYHLHPLVDPRQKMFPELVNAWRNYRFDEMSMEKMRKGGKRDPGPVTSLSAAERETAVLVIGESAARAHMSLYGYDRETNPLLSRKEGIILFRDVVSADFCTYLSLQKMLTFASHQDMQPLFGPTLVDVARAGGYTTFWISNQKSNGRGDLWSKYFSEGADIRIYLNTSDLSDPVDGVILEPFRKVLARPEKKKLIVVHLMGSHFDAIHRYPREFGIYPTPQEGDLFTRRSTQEYINRYDNSMIYNDFILAALLGALETIPGANSFTYVSDHGEDVADATGFVGRSYRMKASKFEIPLLVWFSPDYVQERQEFASSIPAMTGRPFQGDRFIHFYMDILGLRSRAFDGRKSVVNASFRPERRFLNDGFGHSVDYAEFRKSLPPVETAKMERDGSRKPVIASSGSGDGGRQ